MNKTINITVKDKIATAPKDAEYICGNSDYLINFDFDNEWDEFETKTARFKVKGKPPIDQIFSGNVCPIPQISDTYSFDVGVYAGDLHTTTPAYVPARKSILCGGGTPADPPDDVYNQIMQRLNEIGTTDPEAIAAAVADYIAANPIEEKDPTVPAWAKAEKKPEYTAKEVGAIAETELQTAINTALAQAKESGEFDGADGAPGKDGADGQPGADGSPGRDGADGKDGVSVTHSWDGTVLTVTSASGTSSADLKGDTGEPGAPGAAGVDGYTPVKGTDYFTEADKEEIATAAAEKVSIPVTLPNPHALTFTGAVTGSYDGSEAVTVEIPSGGGDVQWELLADVTTEEEVSHITVSLENPGTFKRFAIYAKFVGVSTNQTSWGLYVDITSGQWVMAKETNLVEITSLNQTIDLWIRCNIDVTQLFNQVINTVKYNNDNLLKSGNYTFRVTTIDTIIDTLQFGIQNWNGAMGVGSEFRVYGVRSR